MAVSGSKIIRMTASLDLYDSGQKKLCVRGVRLVAPADGTAVLRKNDAAGEVVYSLSALAKTADESMIPADVEGGKLHLTLTGAACEVFVYLD